MAHNMGPWLSSDELLGATGFIRSSQMAGPTRAKLEDMERSFRAGGCQGKAELLQGLINTFGKEMVTTKLHQSQLQIRQQQQLQQQHWQPQTQWWDQHQQQQQQWQLQQQALQRQLQAASGQNTAPQPQPACSPAPTSPQAWTATASQSAVQPAPAAGTRPAPPRQAPPISAPALPAVMFGGGSMPASPLPGAIPAATLALAWPGLANVPSGPVQQQLHQLLTHAMQEAAKTSGVPVNVLGQEMSKLVSGAYIAGLAAPPRITMPQSSGPAAPPRGPVPIPRGPVVAPRSAPTPQPTAADIQNRVANREVFIQHIQDALVKGHPLSPKQLSQYGMHIKAKAEEQARKATQRRNKAGQGQGSRAGAGVGGYDHGKAVLDEARALEEQQRAELEEQQALAELYNAASAQDVREKAQGIVQPPAYTAPPKETYVLNKLPTLQLLTDEAKKHGLKAVDMSCFAYLADAIEAHMVPLLQSMAKAAAQRSDPARDLPTAERSGVNVRLAVGAIAKADKQLRESKARDEQDMSILRAQMMQDKDEASKELVAQAHEKHAISQAIGQASGVLGRAFSFKAKRKSALAGAGGAGSGAGSRGSEGGGSGGSEGSGRASGSGAVSGASGGGGAVSKGLLRGSMVMSRLSGGNSGLLGKRDASGAAAGAGGAGLHKKGAGGSKAAAGEVPKVSKVCKEEADAGEEEDGTIGNSRPKTKARVEGGSGQAAVRATQVADEEAEGGSVAGPVGDDGVAVVTAAAQEAKLVAATAGGDGSGGVGTAAAKVAEAGQASTGAAGKDGGGGGGGDDGGDHGSGGGGGAARQGGSQSRSRVIRKDVIELGPQDLLSVLERDPVLSKQQVVWKIRNHLSAQ